MEVEMFISGGQSTASSSVLAPTQHHQISPSVTFNEKVKVPLRRLDTWASEHKVSLIDMLWLDMQGYEVFALRGAGELLRSVSVIYAELCHSELYKGMLTRDCYIEQLKDWGFQLQTELQDEEVTEGVFINKNAVKSNR